MRLESSNGYWRACWRDSVGRRRTKSLGSQAKVTKKAATRMMRDLEIQHEIRPATRDAGMAPHLSAFCADYKRLRESEVKEQTLGLDINTIDYMTEFFGESIRLNKITPAMADDWRAWLAREKGLGEATVCGHCRRAKCLFTRAVKRGVLISSPVAELKTTAPDAGKSTDVDMATLERLLDHAPSPAWRALIGLCALAGLRRGEAVRFEQRGIQWDRHRLIVKADKTGKVREVFLEPALEPILLDAVEAADGERIADVGINERNLHRPMLAIYEAAGFSPQKDPFQIWRRWRDITWKLDHPAFVVNSWLGHSEAVSTKNYLSVPESYYTQAETPDQELKRLRAKIAELEKGESATILRQSDS